MTIRDCVWAQANSFLEAIAQRFDSDVLTICVDNIRPGLENEVSRILSLKETRKQKLVVVLDTFGGVVEVVERVVGVIRDVCCYKEVVYIVPEKAMSAGTIWVMSGDRILMMPTACLGPIDPQVLRVVNNVETFVPALSYLTQFERLSKKSADKANGGISPAEYALFLKQYDLAELHRFEQARALSVDLIKDWLSRYKFKDWNLTETSRTAVTGAMKKERAERIATHLNNHERWRSHGRGISIDVLINEVELKVENVGSDPELLRLLTSYWELIKEYRGLTRLSLFFHTKEFF